MSDDPYFAVRDNVKSQVEGLRAKYKKYQHLIQTTDTSTNTEFKDVRKSLVMDVRTVDKNIKALQVSVDQIEKNRLKYPTVKDADLAGRKKFVAETNAVLSEVKSGIDSVAVRKKLEDDANKTRREAYENSAAGLQEKFERQELDRRARAREEENNSFIRDQQQTIKQNIKDQDTQLNQLGAAVDRLGDMSKSINQELKEQDKMLDELGGDMEHELSRFEVVQEQLGKLLKTKDTCQIWTIVILAAVLIILICCVIWVP